MKLVTVMEQNDLELPAQKAAIMIVQMLTIPVLFQLDQRLVMMIQILVTAPML